MKVTIWGPMPHDESMRVHAPDCREPRRNAEYHLANHLTLDVPSEKELAEVLWGDIAGDNWDPGTDEWRQEVNFLYQVETKVYACAGGH